MKKQRDLSGRGAIVMLIVGIGTTGIMLGVMGTKLVREMAFSQRMDVGIGGLEKQPIVAVSLEDETIFKMQEVALKLFKESSNRGENMLIAPPSLFYVIGTIANGAEGETLNAFKQALGDGEWTLEEWNSASLSLQQQLQANKSTRISNDYSIWLKDHEELQFKTDFLQQSLATYNGQVYKVDFTNPLTADFMNRWLMEKGNTKTTFTANLIDAHTSMYLLSTTTLEGSWEKNYNSNAVLGGLFRMADGRQVEATYMYSIENYIANDEVEGIIKPYEEGAYSFVAILPKGGVDLYEYIKNLEVETFTNLIENQKGKTVAALPKFANEKPMSINKALVNLGLKEAFDGTKANFSKLCEVKDANYYISNLYHEASIKVDECGTRPRTNKQNQLDTAELKEATYDLAFNSPFMYAVIDHRTQLPLMMGVLANPSF